MSNIGVEIFAVLSYPEKHLYTFKSIVKNFVLKSKCKLQVFKNDEMHIEYSIAINRKPIGVRHFEGDDKTLEEIYRIKSKNTNSGDYKNLGISYPSGKNTINENQNRLKSVGLIKIQKNVQLDK
jgi:murein L,D-transpeptidase YafK